MTENKLSEFGFYKSGIDRYFHSELDFEIRHLRKQSRLDLVSQILTYGIEHGKEIGKQEIISSFKTLLNISENEN